MSVLLIDFINQAHPSEIASSDTTDALGEAGSHVIRKTGAFLALSGLGLSGHKSGKDVHKGFLNLVWSVEPLSRAEDDASRVVGHSGTEVLWHPDEGSEAAISLELAVDISLGVDLVVVKSWIGGRNRF